MNFDILPELHWQYGYAYFCEYGMSTVCVPYCPAAIV